MKNFQEHLLKLGFKSKREFLDNYLYELQPFENEVTIKHAFNLRRNAVRRYVLENKPDCIDDYLLNILENRLYESQKFVYSKNKVYNMKLSLHGDEIKMASEVHNKLSDSINLNEVFSCGYFPSKNLNYILLTYEKGSMFLMDAFKKTFNFENADEFEKLLFQFGSVCKTILEQGYLYSLKMDDYIVKKENDEFQIFPINYSLENHKYKRNSLIFLDHFNEMKENLGQNSDLIRNFKKGFNSH